MGLIYKSYLVTLNQRVPGSSPGAPTKQDQWLRPRFSPSSRLRKPLVHTFVHTFRGQSTI